MACRWQNMTFSSSSHLRIFTWSLRYLSVEWAGKGHKVHKCRMVSTGVLEADKDAKGWLDKLYSVKLVNLLGGYGSSGCWRWAPPQTDRHCCTSVAVPDGWYFLYCAAEKMVQRGLVAVLTSSRHKYGGRIQSQTHEDRKLEVHVQITIKLKADRKETLESRFLSTAEKE